MRAVCRSKYKKAHIDKQIETTGKLCMIPYWILFFLSKIFGTVCQFPLTVLRFLIPCLLFVISGCRQKENRPNVMLFCKRQPN